MEVAQSYYSITIRHRFSVYEQRVMLKIVERCNDIMRQQGRYADFINRAYDMRDLHLLMAFPISELAGNTHNWRPVRNALLSLQQVTLQYWLPHDKIWRSAPFVTAAEIDAQNGVAKVSVSQWLVDYITDFSNGGFRYYMLENAFSLRNSYASRLYTLVYSMTKPIVYELTAFKKLLGIDIAQYSRAHDLERRVLRPAADELKKKGYNGFSYELLRQYKEKSDSKPIAVRITPVHRENAARKPMEERVQEFYSHVPASLGNYLTSRMGFTIREMSGKNMQVLEDFGRLPGWQAKLMDICERARRKGKTKGYIIAAMRSEVKNLGA